MARRRTRKQKIALQARTQRRELIEKLENEKLELIKKQDELAKEHKKAIRIKNLKIFKSLFKLSYPYVLAMVGVQIPVFVFQGGLPFKIDSYSYKKEYTLETTYDGEVTYQEEYIPGFWWKDTSHPNELKITTPWELCEDGTKKRIIREYNITYSDEIVDTILARDYDTLESLIVSCSSEIVETTNDPNIQDEEYHLEGKLGIVDLNSSIKVNESKRANEIITKSEIGIFILMSILILKYRKFRFIKNAKELKRACNEKVRSLNIESEDLTRKKEEIAQKILSIKNGVR